MERARGREGERETYRLAFEGGHTPYSLTLLLTYSRSPMGSFEAGTLIDKGLD